MSPPASAWSPLANRVFRALWIAQTVSLIGTWMHEVGAAWLMTTLAPSALMVALVQAASAAPSVAFALPSGALADVIDRRKLIIGAQLGMMVVAASLAVLTWTEVVTAPLLLVMTFLLGTGSVLSLPAWSALLPEIVGERDLAPAIALNGVSLNLSRAIGPALGGVVITAAGPWAVFALNALSFIGVTIVFAFFDTARPASTVPQERLLGAIRTGVAYVRHSEALHTVLWHTVAFIVPGSALWALLAITVKQQMGAGAVVFGSLVAAIGLGAVAMATILPRVRARYSADAAVLIGSALFAVATLALAVTASLWVIVPAMFVGGCGWLLTMATLNTAAQRALPGWVKARGLAVYQLSFFSGFAGGSIAWGVVAERLGLATTLAAASVMQVVLATVARRRRVARTEGLNLRPSARWPEPAFALEPGDADRPVAVQIEYEIDDANVTAFLRDIEALGRTRKRDGALSWFVMRDAARPARFVEHFVAPSWADHQRQHARFTEDDRAIQERVNAHQRAGSRPVVTHLVLQRRAPR